VSYTGSAPEIGTKFRVSTDTSKMPPGDTLIGWATLHQPERFPDGDRPLNQQVEEMLDELSTPQG
jgi:hypothetical protein